MSVTLLQMMLCTACGFSFVQSDFPSEHCKCSRCSYPHVSLSWGTDGMWSEVGSFVNDWQLTADPSVHSTDSEAYHTSSIISARGAAWCAPGRGCGFLSDLAYVPALTEVPSQLLAEGPHDFELIKIVEPLTITVKTHHRLCQQQYSLKPD